MGGGIGVRPCQSRRKTRAGEGALCSNLSTLSSEKHVKHKTIYPSTYEGKAECFRSNAKIPPSQKPPQLAEEELFAALRRDKGEEANDTRIPFLSLSFFSFLIEVSSSPPPFPPLLLPETEFSNFPSSPGVVNSDFQPLPFYQNKNGILSLIYGVEYSIFDKSILRQSLCLFRPLLRQSCSFSHPKKLYMGK